MAGVKNQMQKTGEPMLKFFTGLDFCLFVFCFFFGKLEGGEKKMQISGESMPIFFTVNLPNTFL